MSVPIRRVVPEVEMPAALSSSDIETGMALLIVCRPQFPFEANTAAKSFSRRNTGIP